jgi:arabinose-5-phosphate isomerase
VSEIYTHNALPMVTPEASIKDVILEISAKRLGCTAVVDGNKNLLGIITDGDLRRMLQKDTPLERFKAADIMTVSPRKIEKDAFAVKALHVMQENNITQIVVMDGDKIAGFVHLHDLLKEGIV